MSGFDREAMLETFIYEMNQLLEQMEQIIIQGEEGYDEKQINEIFRIMHTLKGSAAMMMFDTIATTSHKMEDLFFYLREERPTEVDYLTLTDLVLKGTDFIKAQIGKIENGESEDPVPDQLVTELTTFLKVLKGEGAPKKEEKPQTVQAKNKPNSYEARIFFEENTEMENIRGYNLIHNLKDDISNVITIPEDLFDENMAIIIKEQGLIINFNSKHNYETIYGLLSKGAFIKSLELKAVNIKIDTSSEKYLYVATLKYDENCEMENVRAYSVVHNLKDVFTNIKTSPEDLMNEDNIIEIRNNGFVLEFESSKSYDEVHEILSNTIYLKDLKLDQQVIKNNAKQNIQEIIKEKHESKEQNQENKENTHEEIKENKTSKDESKKQQVQKVISVNITKLDQLLNLMGELVIAEAMVTQNRELDGLELESFYKEARHLRKIITDVQENVMSMRMVPLSPTFFKMHRIVRDMCRSLSKDVKLVLVGEDTEVDKNIIEHISDPLMHIIRNSVDHGIEMPEDRKKVGKDPQGTVHLEAKNSGGDVLIIIKDDGSGLNKEKIMAKAKKNGLLKKPPEEYTDKEIYQFIFLPGFSTNEVVTGYSGRGVGMDVVTTNIESVGGSILVDSTPSEGSTFTLKIPLTLAIIDGMTIEIGKAKYTIPIISIKQSFKPSEKDLFTDPSGNEMITVRGNCYNVVRLNEFFSIPTRVDKIEDGIMLMLENGEQTICLLADELIGEQQVVVKSIPKYIKKPKGISGCTLLGDGDISLILDVAGFFDK